MSKQSNQRYRKEKEKALMNKVNEGSKDTNNDTPKDKFNREFDSPSNNTNR